MRSLCLVLVFAFATSSGLAQTQKDPDPFPVPGRDQNVTRYINKKGEVVLTVPYQAGSFHDGLARVWDRGMVGYVDRAGQVVIKPQNRTSMDFSQGMAIFFVTSNCQRADNKSLYGFIDREGKTAIEPRLTKPCNHFGNNYDFKEGGLALVEVGKLMGFIDQTGKIVMEFDDADAFSEGLAPVKIKGKFGFVNSKGKVVIKPQFEKAWSFSEGLAAVTVNGKTGFVDKRGKFVIEPQFKQAVSFSDGMAAVQVGEKWGYIDRTGRIVVTPDDNPTYSVPFVNGRAVKTVDQEEGYIDKTGRLVIEPQYARAPNFTDGLAYVLNNESLRWEVIDVNGNVVYRPPEPKRPPPNLNNPFEKVMVTDDVKWLEEVAGWARSGSNQFFSGRLASHPKDLSTAAYARLGELGTPESIEAIKRIELAAGKDHTLTPKFVALGISAHPTWHTSDSDLKPFAQAKRNDGTTFGLVWQATLGDLNAYLISSKTPDDPESWTRPRLIPDRIYRGLSNPGLAVKGNDTLIFSFTQDTPPPRGIMEGTHDPGPTSPKLGPQQVEISITAVERDTDGDGWTDNEEQRLGLDPRNQDSDKDGIPDGQDIWPNKAIVPGSNDEDTQILRRALFAVFGIGGSSHLLLVASPVQPVEIIGYKGPVLFGEDVKSWIAKGNQSGVFVRWRIRKKSANAAIVEIVDYEGPLAAGGQDVRLKKIGNEWYVVNRRTTWIS
jgi:hypothetical protein